MILSELFNDSFSLIFNFFSVLLEFFTITSVVCFLEILGFSVRALVLLLFSDKVKLFVVLISL